jgi:iron complex outermembrane receptor protein
VEAGSFRGADIMDVPSTVNVVTREVLELQAAGGLYDALRNTAGVTPPAERRRHWDQLVIRGIAVENRTNYRLNGSLPIMNFSQVPMEDKERGSAERRHRPVLRLYLAGRRGQLRHQARRRQAGQHGRHDGGPERQRRRDRRCGAPLWRAQQVGVRINAAGGTLGSYLDNVGNGNRKFASAALDWRVNARLLLKADLEYDQRRVTEQAGIALPAAVNGVIALPPRSIRNA